jgi:hypothetical protein
MPDIAGVLREPEFSPGRVDDDAAILERTAQALAARGVRVRIGSAAVLDDPDLRGVLAMCQSADALVALDRLAARIPIVNTPRAIRACHRRATAELLARAGVPFPGTRFVATATDGAPPTVPAPCWIKRADVHAMHPDDVVFAPTAAAVPAVLAAFAARGIAEVALQEHVAGPVVKCYGVAGGRFFRCYVDDADAPAPISVLSEVAARAAAVVGLDVFGGDLVVPAGGGPVVVDVNDWPSFARCRDEAADAIADYVIERLRRGSRIAAAPGTAVGPV